jgi:DNA-binding MarR family transcriptional regulator
LAKSFVAWKNYDISVVMSSADPNARRWLLVSKHGLALLQLARNPTSSAREVADAIGIGERQAQRLLGDLLEAGYVRKHPTGRRNQYELIEDARMRHPMLAHVGVRPLLECLLDNLEAAAEPPA